MNKHVVVTGIGALSSLGIEKQEHLLAHRNASFSTTPSNIANDYFPTHTGLVREFNPKQYIKDKKSIRMMNRQVVLGLCSATLAIRDAQLDENYLVADEDNHGVIFGAATSQGVVAAKDPFLDCLNDDLSINYYKLGAESYRIFPPLWILPRLPNTTAGQISIQNSLKGVNYSVVNGSSSGMVAIGEAFESIQDSRSTLIVCGASELDPGADYISRLAAQGVAAIDGTGGGSFIPNSTGILVSEAGATLVLESEQSARQRHAQIYGYIRAYTNSYLPKIKQLEHLDRVAMIEANFHKTLKGAGLTATDVDLVQASACGLSYLDQAEALAISRVFGNQVAVSATAPYTGHTLAASGAITCYYALLQLEQGYIAPVAKQGELFYQSRLDYVMGESRPAELNTVLCSTLDFMGNMCSLLISKGN